MTGVQSPPPTAPWPKTSALAVWSLVLGILSLSLLAVCIGPLFAIPAVICGHMAYSRVKRSGGVLGGQGFALAGFILGYTSIGLTILLSPVLLAVAIPNFYKARETAQKNACVERLRQIDTAKQQWALENKKSDDDIPTAQDLDPYVKGGFASLHCPGGGAYAINMVREAPTCSIAGHVLEAGVPSSAGGAPPAATGINALRDPRLLLNPDRPRPPPGYQPPPRVLSQYPGQTPVRTDRDRCITNLRCIEIAKQIWANDNHKQPTDVPTESEILQIMHLQLFLRCPDGGTYTIGAVGELPTCSVPHHQLPANASVGGNVTAPR